MSLNKFTNIPLLKNDAKLKKVTNNHTKKSIHPKFVIKIKNMFQKKKSHLVQIKINYHIQALKNQKKKKLEKKREAMLMPKKKKRKRKKSDNSTKLWKMLFSTPFSSPYFLSSLFSPYPNML